MRILQVITSLQTGGAEKLVVDITKQLRKRGYIVDVVVFNGVDTPFMQQLAETGCKIYKLSTGGSVYNPCYIFRLMQIMKNYDVVHTHNTSPQFFAAIANIYNKKKLVTTEHSTNNRRRKWRCYGWIDNWMYKQYGKIICISDVAREKLQSYLHTTNKSIITINNGVDVNLFYNAKPITEFCSQELFTTVMVAGFREAKDQDTIIRAMALLPENYILWLVGDGVRRSELEKLTTALKMNNRVKMFGNRSDIPNILKSADIIVMSSHWEGLSLSNIEGMSVGKPFIASNVDGLREVTEGYGVLFPHEDAETLAEIIKKLHDDKDYYNSIAESCYKRAQMFDIKNMVDGYEAVYKKLLE